jgi:lambda repressor-like predicted transcriptional regulator
VPPKPTPPPNTWATGDPWHAHPLSPDAPPYAHVAQHAAATIHTHLTATGTSLRTAATQAGVDHGTLSRVIAGNTVPDIATLAALADALDIDIWPTRRPS